MGNYANIQNEVRRTIYQNSGGAITGASLQELLLSVINVLGNESCFKGVLSNDNKPSAAVDGKQWYVGYSANGTTTVNLTAVGLGTLSITPTDLYIVYSTVSGWAAVNIGSGIGATIGTLNTSIGNVGDAVQHIYAAQKDCVRIMVDAADDGEYTVINDVTNVKFMAVDGVPIEVTDKPGLSAGGHSVDFIFEDTSLFMSNSIIPERCFQGISILKSVIIPSYILAIGDSAFEGSAVSSVYCFGTEPPALGDSVFADTGVFVGGEFSEVHVPSGTEAAYINAWGSGTYQELSII